jgi:hypothetical protein
MTMKNLFVRGGLVAAGFALTIAATRVMATTQTDAVPAAGSHAAAQASAGRSPTAMTVVPALGREEGPRVEQLRQARIDAHAADVARREEVRTRLLADPLTRPLGELMGKYLDVPRAKLAASPEDIAAFRSQFADPETGARFATRALELLPRDGFGFERSAVLAGLDSLIDRGLEATVVPVMMDELARTVIAAPEAEASGTLDLGLPQIAQRSLLRAPSVADATAVAATARAMLANSHPTVIGALARQLVAIRPNAKAALVAELGREGYPEELIPWEETSHAQ